MRRGGLICDRIDGWGWWVVELLGLRDRLYDFRLGRRCDLVISKRMDEWMKVGSKARVVSS
jgi:hypothetical protein